MARRPRRARQNRGFEVDPGLSLDDADFEKGVDQYTDWHWGIGPQKVIDGDDQDMPRILIECGKLIRLHVRAPHSTRHPRRQRDTMIEFSQAASRNCHLAYDPEHPYQRLYMLIRPRNARAALKRRFWDHNEVQALPLGHLAVIAGGRHAERRDYPDVMVKPIGIPSNVVYWTNKQGDGLSFYIHKMAEVSGHFPILCVDQKGRLWFAGGSYTSPTPGITD